MTTHVTDGPWYLVPMPHHGGRTRVPNKLAAGMLATRHRSRPRPHGGAAPDASSDALALSYHGTLDALRARGNTLAIWAPGVCACCGQKTSNHRTLRPRMQARLRLLRYRFLHRHPVKRSPLP